MQNYRTHVKLYPLSLSGGGTPYAVLVHISQTTSSDASVWETSCPEKKEEQKKEENEEEEEKGAASCYPEDATRWEKGHPMALGSGSSVSENVWTLIKMCRASVVAPFLSSILSVFPFTSLPLSSAHRKLLARRMRAIARKRSRDF